MAVLFHLQNAEVLPERTKECTSFLQQICGCLLDAPRDNLFPRIELIDPDTQVVKYTVGYDHAHHGFWRRDEQTYDVTLVERENFSKTLQAEWELSDGDIADLLKPAGVKKETCSLSSPDLGASHPEGAEPTEEETEQQHASRIVWSPITSEQIELALAILKGVRVSGERCGIPAPISATSARVKIIDQRDHLIAMQQMFNCRATFAPCVPITSETAMRSAHLETSPSATRTSEATTQALDATKQQQQTSSMQAQPEAASGPDCPVSAAVPAAPAQPSQNEDQQAQQPAVPSAHLETFPSATRASEATTQALDATKQQQQTSSMQAQPEAASGPDCPVSAAVPAAPAQPSQSEDQQAQQPAVPSAHLETSPSATRASEATTQALDATKQQQQTSSMQAQPEAASGPDCPVSAAVPAAPAQPSQSEDQQAQQPAVPSAHLETFPSATRASEATTQALDATKQQQQTSSMQAQPEAAPMSAALPAAPSQTQQPAGPSRTNEEMTQALNASKQQHLQQPAGTLAPQAVASTAAPQHGAEEIPQQLLDQLKAAGLSTQFQEFLALKIKQEQQQPGIKAEIKQEQQRPTKRSRHDLPKMIDLTLDEDSLPEKNESLEPRGSKRRLCAAVKEEAIETPKKAHRKTQVEMQLSIPKPPERRPRLRRMSEESILTEGERALQELKEQLVLSQSDAKHSPQEQQQQLPQMSAEEDPSEWVNCLMLRGNQVPALGQQVVLYRGYPLKHLPALFHIIESIDKGSQSVYTGVAEVIECQTMQKVRDFDPDAQYWKATLQAGKTVCKWTLRMIKVFDQGIRVRLTTQKFRNRHWACQRQMLTSGLHILPPQRASLYETAPFFFKLLSSPDYDLLRQTALMLDGKKIRVGSTCSGSDICIIALKSVLRQMNREFNAAWQIGCFC